MNEPHDVTRAKAGQPSLAPEGWTTLGEVMDFEVQELQAMAYAAHEALQQGDAARALKLSLTLAELDPFDFTPLRAAAFCLQRLSRLELAAHYAQLALTVNGAPDIATLACLADCCAGLGDKETALAASKAVLAAPVTKTLEQVYVDRAKRLHAYLSA